MIKILNSKNKNAFIDSLKDRKQTADVESIVKQILADIKSRGDDALIEYCKKFDGVDKIEVLSKADLKKYYDKADKSFVTALENAKKNIVKYHSKQVKIGYEIREQGVLLGQRIRPLKTVGIYVPGGTASYPSSVLMNAIPAKIAGVKNIVMVTPPPKFENQNQDILTAAYIADVDKVIFVGGAQSIGALAYGTKTIEKADKIVGPGNIFVATAKKLVFGECDIDMVAGPSEILVVADKTANAKFVAYDMMSQAEHDANSSAILLTQSEDFALSVQQNLQLELDSLQRKDIAQKALDNFSAIIICESFEEIIETANKIAPEHLELVIENAEEYIDDFDCAGSIFLGSYAPEALGDYYAGANHILPTSGTARFASPLSVDSFYKKYSYLSYDKDTLRKAKQDIELIASREGLFAHKNSISVRFEDEE